MKVPKIGKFSLSRAQITLAILSLLFLVFQIFVITPIKVENSASLKFDWPDEVANYFWTKELATNHRLSIPEPLNAFASYQIHPRSFNTNISGALVPGSFLGLIILFAFLAKIFGTWAIVYFTPILMIGGVWAFYFLLRKIFNSEKIAWWSAALLLFSAPWLYYSFESLLPNVPFVSLALIGASLFFCVKEKQKFIWFLAGLSGGLALAIRPSEFVWLAVAYLTILIAKRKELNIWGSVLTLAGAWLAILPSLFFQKWIYGSLFVSGYDKLPALANQNNVFLHLLKQALIPFGFHPLLALSNFWHYFVMVSPLSFVFFVLGVLIYLKKWRTQSKNSRVYFLLTLFIFIWLFNYYGSWQFEDQRTLSLNIIGASYVRYWLILFALSLPFVGLLFEELSLRLKSKNVSSAAFLLLVFLSFYSILISDPNNILAVRRKVAANRLVAINLLQNIPANAIIVTDRSDKIFFPERRVIETFGLRGDLERTISTIKVVVPLYRHKDGKLIPL